jgi:uncharacterized protein (DUF1015 family)
MARLVPVPTAVVDPDWASRVVSPPHDALSSADRRDYLRSHPDSYLRVTWSVDEPPPTGPSISAHALAGGRAALERLWSAGAFRPAPGPGLLVYRLSDNGHSQVGVVGATTVADHDSGVIRPHEEVDPERAVALAEHVMALRVQSSPIALTHRPDPAVDALVAEATAGGSSLDLVTEDGLRQQVWTVDAERADAIIEQLAERPLYVVDGHHRSEAARRLRATDPSPTTELVLSSVFPADQLRNQAFHRGLIGIDSDLLVADLARRFPLRSAVESEVPDRAAGELALLAGGRWYLVSVPPRAAVIGHEPESFAGLDAVRLQRSILGPILGIDPGRPDGRLVYVPPADEAGPDGEADGEAGRVAGRAAEWGCEALWLLRPVPVPALLDAADAGLVLPPKSTYFEPKVRSGVFLWTLA